MAPGRQQRQPARQSFATNMKLHSVRTGSKSILFTFSGDDRTKAYKWSKYGCLTQNKEIQKYACTSCRSIYDSSRKEGILNRPLAWIKFNVANNCFETDEPENRHVCDGPIEMNTVRGTEAARAELFFFHVRQCCHRQLQQRGLTAEFPEETKKFIKHCATRIGGLQHIPVGLIDEAVAALRVYLDNSIEEYGKDIVGAIRLILDDYFVPTWLNHSLGRNFFSAGDLSTNRTDNYAEQFHSKQSLYYKKKHLKLGAFMYDDRLLQNHIVEHVKLIEAGERDAPEKNDSGDRKILQQRRKLTQNIQQMLHPNERADEIIKRLYHLGKAAGMTALLD